MLAGSLTPYWSDYYTLDHYLFIDSTGAEYRLNVNTSGVWSTSEGLFLRYEDSSKRLYFPDGSFWTFGSLSGGDEPDAGTSYPTVIQDTNGNQITISYAGGNTTARIVNVEDVRAVVDGGGRHSYALTYDGSNHLTHLTNLIADAASKDHVEDYDFTYSSAQTLTNPFTGATFGMVKVLQTVVATGISLTTTFTTDTTGSLTKVTFPAGGYIRWQHTNATYVGTRLQPEVLNRYISADGSTESTYTISRDSGDSSRNVHLYADITDPGGIGKKKWNFNTTSSSFTVGLLLSTEGWQLPGTPVKRLQTDYTWASSWSQVLTRVTTTTNPGTNQISKYHQWGYDAYGNVAAHSIIFPASNFPGYYCCNSRTYSFTYLTDTNYTSRYITNRLVSTSASGQGNLPGSYNNYYGDYYSPTTVALNYYDNDSSSPCYAGGYGSIPSVSGSYEHDDTNYGTGLAYRGNLTGAASLNGVQCAQYDMLGNSPTQLDTVGRVHSTGFAYNYAAPNSASMGSYSESATYNTLLDPTQKVDLNGTMTPDYDAYERPSQVTSPLGVVTTYAYTVSPPTVTATTNGRWMKTTMDGLGRTTLVETGYSTTTVNQAETEYYANGKLYRTSLPHAPSTSARWTTYTYDGLGRTLTVVAADGASTTSYAYLANTITITDPAGAWKKYTLDELGNIMIATEPNPAGGTWDTTYKYNLFGQLKEVKVIRGANTQTRTYTYNSNRQMTQSVTPEQGTTTYAYYSNGLPRYKIDAKGAKVENNYDSQGRLTSVYTTPYGGGASLALTNTWDSGYVNFTYTSAPGRLLNQVFPVSTYTTATQGYTYNSNGAVTSKSLYTNRFLGAAYSILKADITYDSEGRVASLKYPNTPLGTGATYNYTYNNLSQLDTMAQSGGGTLVNGVTYGAAGELLTMTFGGYNEARTYNTMYQMTRLTDTPTGGGAATVDLIYNFSTTQNNGKITSQQDVVSGETVQYSYDALNRLLLAETTSSAWGQGYVYDGFGNLLQQNVTKGSAPSYSVSVDASTNRLTGVSYDANGNDLSSSKTYDDLNRLATAGGASYGYSADNKRIFKALPGGGYEWYFYLGNQRLGKYETHYDSGTDTHPITVATTNLYFGGRLISTGGAAVLTDRLGSNITGGKSYFPYGQEKPSATSNNIEKFTGYYRDAETGLDYADQRYHGPGTGRFLTPDPAGDGRNWYAYAGGDPINNVDPTGLSDTWCTGGSGIQTSCVRTCYSYEYCYGGPLTTGPAGIPTAPEMIVDGLPASILCLAAQYQYQFCSNYYPSTTDPTPIPTSTGGGDPGPSSPAPATTPAPGTSSVGSPTGPNLSSLPKVTLNWDPSIFLTGYIASLPAPLPSVKIYGANDSAPSIMTQYALPLTIGPPSPPLPSPSAGNWPTALKVATCIVFPSWGSTMAGQPTLPTDPLVGNANGLPTIPSINNKSGSVAIGNQVAVTMFSGGAAIVDYGNSNVACTVALH